MSLNTDVREVIDHYESDPNGEGYGDHDFRALAVHLDGRGRSKRTVIQNIRYLAWWSEPFTKRNVRNVVDWAQDEAASRFDDQNSRNRFVYNLYLAVKHYIQAMGEKQLIGEDLPDSRDVPKPSANPNTTRFTEDQVQRMMAQASTEELRLAIACMFYGGMRSAEIFACTAEWFAFESKAVEVEIPAEHAKGRQDGDPEPEWAYLPTDYANALKQYIKQQYGWDGEYADLYAELADEDQHGEFWTLFNFGDNLPESEEKSLKRIRNERYHLDKKLKQMAKKAGINDWDDITPHSLRRSSIFHIYDKNKDLNKTAEVVRHKDPKVTRHYLRLDKEQQKNAWLDVYGGQDA